VPIEIHQLAERFDRRRPGVLLYWRITCYDRRRQGEPLVDGLLFDKIFFPHDPLYL